jgi:hypothetical protein
VYNFAVKYFGKNGPNLKSQEIDCGLDDQTLIPSGELYFLFMYPSSGAHPASSPLEAVAVFLRGPKWLEY